MGAPLLWSGDLAKLLKKVLNFNDQTHIEAGDTNPSVTPTAGLRGYLYISSNGGLYIKQDSGSTTNWIDLASDTGAVWGSITGTLSNQTDLQNALNLKAPLNSPTFTGTIGTPLTVSKALTTDGSGNLAASGTSSTELGYVTGVTSAIQTQLNSKQSTLTIGDLTDVGTDGIVVTNGVGSVIGSGTSLAQHVSDASHNGYLSSTDWTTFNSKQAAGSYITALTGGVTASGPGSATATVVTNANLTGPIISVGNATSIASQTGTGSTFVVDNGPTLITPVLGVATATTVNKVTFTPPASNATLTIADGKTLIASDNATVSNTNTGDITLASVGSSPAAAGASLSGQVLTLQPADGTNPGVITTGSQTIAGTKTFSSTISGSINGNAATVTTNANLTGGVTSVGNAATVITNANLTGPVTSTGNATAIANGAISNAMLANSAVANLSGTNTGDQTITLTGQVTGSGTGSFAASITPNPLMGQIFS